MWLATSSASSYVPEPSFAFQGCQSKRRRTSRTATLAFSETVEWMLLNDTPLSLAHARAMRSVMNTRLRFSVPLYDCSRVQNLTRLNAELGE